MENVTEKETVSISKTNGKPVKPVYTIAQLTEHYQAFDTSKAIVNCALKLSGKTGFTVEEAQKIIDTFRNQK